MGIPPVLHMGSCVDNSRILMAATACVKAGGLGTDISDLPAAGAAPEWMSEKAISIGHYFVASGVYTMFGVTFPTTGSELLTDYLFKGLEEELGGKWDFEPDPELAAKKMIAHIDLKRKALGIDKARERVLMRHGYAPHTWKPPPRATSIRIKRGPFPYRRDKQYPKDGTVPFR